MNILDFLKKFLIRTKNDNIMMLVIEAIEYLKVNFLDVREFGILDLEIENSKYL